jgi:hypothetical protein
MPLCGAPGIIWSKSYCGSGQHVVAGRSDVGRSGSGRAQKEGDAMLFLKACPHCRGDLVFENDARAGYLECVQCGHLLSAQEERRLGVHTTRKGLLHPVAPTHRAVPTPAEPAALR